MATAKKTIWITLVLLCTTPVLAQEVTIVTEILPPWQTRDGNEVGGVATEVVRATLREIDIEAKIRAYPWARAYRIALDQPNVLIYSILRSHEREKLFKWVGVIGSIKEHFFHMAHRTDISLATINEAKKYVTIIPQDDLRHQFLTKRGFKEKLMFYLVNRQEQALRMLYAGRGDLIIDDEPTLSYELRQLKLDPSKIAIAIHIPEMSVNFEMAFSKQTPDSLVNKFRKGLETIKASGLYHHIISWYEMPPLNPTK